MRGNNEKNKINPRIKEVLKILGAGTLLMVALIMPGPSYMMLKVYEDIKAKEDEKEWNKYNTRRLKQVIKRLEKQKIVEFKDGLVKVTDKGKTRLLKYNLEEMELTRKTDGIWRFIIYDIANLRKPQRELFRAVLKRLKFFRIQKSVYLTPFVCDNEIEYIRQIFDIGNEVIILKVSNFENDEVYKKYF